MQKKEASFQTEFNTWLRSSHKATGVFELKHTRGKDYLPFNEVREHQINALLACKHGTFVYKISDMGLAFKPFDCFAMSGVPAFVVIKYPENWYMIDVDDFIRTRDASTRKSLTEDMARLIAADI